MVGRATFPLRCNAPVTITVAIEDDCTAQIDNVREYDTIHDNFLDGKQRRLSLSAHFHANETVHTMVMTKGNHLNVPRSTPPPSPRFRPLTESLNVVALLKNFADTSDLFRSENTAD